MHDAEDITGILLCGGAGTRLFPLTDQLNKHFLPVFDKPLFYYPLSVLLLLNLKKIKIVCNADQVDEFTRRTIFLKFLDIDYELIAQDKPRGVAHAVHCAAKNVDTKNILIILGDNIFFGADLTHRIKGALKTDKKTNIFTHIAKDPNRFGVLQRDHEDQPKNIIEKPSQLISNEVITGIYFFDRDFFASSYSQITLSRRGEFEISDVLQHGISKNMLEAIRLPRGIFWIDAGTIEDLYTASDYVRSYQQRLGNKIANIEEIALTQKLISNDGMVSLLRDYPDSEYTQYISNLVSYAK